MNLRAGTRLAIGFLALLCLASLVLYDGKLKVHWTYMKSEYVVPVRTLQSNSECSTTTTISSAVASTIRSPGGFVLALRFWEQQTQAMKTLVQLQCLATHMGMRTVEPFLHKSLLGFPLPEVATGGDFLHLSDLVDIDLWNRETTSKLDLFPLSSWSEFLENSPRNLILVCIRHHNPPRIRIPEPGFDYRTGCPNECFLKLESNLAPLNGSNPFRIVHKACVNFIDYAGSVSEKSLFENILGRFKERVTIVINEFRGFFGLYRASILTSCGIDLYKPNITIDPSARIQRDARRYAQEVFNGEPYIAVLVRIERVVLHLEHNITECNGVLKSLLQTLSERCNTRRYFLAMDVGKFGSRGSTLHNLTVHGRDVLNTVYNGAVSFEEWESKFERYTSSVEEAYVANLQRAIAAGSQCLVMFGAGGFQGQARDFYERRHPHIKDKCIHKMCHEHKSTAPLHVQMSKFSCLS